MTWVAGHSWVLLLLSALAGFAFTWWWMVRKIRGRVPITKEVAAVAASSGAAGASAAGAGVAAGAATLAGGTAARELKWTSETPVAERPDVEAEGPAAGVGADAPTADLDAPEVDLDDSLIGAAELDGADVGLTETDAHAPEVGLSLPAGDVVAADAVAVADPLDGAEAPARVDRDTDADVDPHVGDSASARDGDTAGDTAGDTSGDDAGDSAGDSADRESEAHTETDAAADQGSDNNPVEADGESETAAAAAGLLGGTAAASYAVGSFGEGSVDPLPDGSMPVGFDVKGNADSMLYHSPKSPWYARTKAEVWFRDEESAAAAGFARWDSRGRGTRGSAGAGGDAATLAAPSYAVGSFGEGSVDPLPDGSMPVGFDVKGNADSMLYHSPESPWYARTKAEVWFRDEESAAAAGFARWDSRGRGSRGAAADSAAGAVGTGAAAAFAAPSYAVGSFGEGSVDPLPDGSMPVGFDVKGNADSMLYHSPESPWYARTKAEVWFRDEESAAAAGFARWDSRGRGTRGSAGAGGDAATLAAPSYAVGSFGEGSVDPLPDGSMPVGFDVKGNADSMLYHSSKSPWYARTKAEVWFRDEATAAAAGFKHWDPAKR